MSDYSYILEPYKGMSSRYTCPECGKGKTFSRYIDIETGEQLNDGTGRCNREIECNYHRTPKEYFADNNIKIDTSHRQPKRVQAKQLPASYIPFDTFKGSLQHYERNNFVAFLVSLFGEEITSQLIGRYFLGTSRHWRGANVFWQVDSTGKIRTGKIMLYNTVTGRRIKKPFSYITWVHKAVKQPNFNLNQCLFGAHLLTEQSKPVAIVESEKTAVIASVYLPQFIWLASGSLANLSLKRCQTLQGRSVTLWPDINGFDKWSEKAKELSSITTVTVSDILEQKATEDERQEGLDLADYLIRYSLDQFTTQPAEATILKEKKPKEYIYQREAVSWCEDVAKLERFFDSVQPPTAPIRLQAGTITDLPVFIHSHMTTVKANDGKATYLPYLNRLHEVKEMLSK